MTTIDVPQVPFPLAASSADAWRVDGGTGALTVTARPHSDLFIDPGSGSPLDERSHLNAESQLNALTLLGVPPEGDFRLSARVSVDFTATFDAGVLLLWIDETHWAKLCFEHSPDGEAMVVSVVTREVSDDANGFVVEGRSVWLRVSRIGHAYAYHASLDGRTWRLIRFFALHPAGTASVGFEAQAPTGDGCAVTFDHIRFSQERLADLRDGS
jgi:regulation of enolase protein 1 (concanavalin A-like superfamily)